MRQKNKHEFLGSVGYYAKYSFMTLSLFSLLSASASAGGFAVREQSTTGLGSAFAGVAAGGGPSSIYWNGATISDTKGLETESSYNIILPDSTISNTTDGGVDIDTLGLTSSSAVAYQVNDQLYLGFSLSAPLGFKTRADNQNFSGAHLGKKSSVFSINANPVIAYKVMPGLTLSAGAQIEYLQIKLHSAAGFPVAPATPTASVEGDDIGFGFTAGMMYQPTDSTSIGLGYRSSIDHTLGGDFKVNGNKLADITADFKTPDLVTFSLRQKITPSVTLLGTVEWSKWSNLQELSVKGAPGAPTAFKWKDSWFYSVGGEMDVTDKWTLRTGVAYEKSPVPDETRSVRLPDADRLWLSLGASYQWSEATKIHAGYSHVFVEDSKIDQPGFKGDVETSLNIVSFGFQTKW